MATLTSILDTYVYSASPSTVFQNSPKLRLQGSGGTAYAYVKVSGFATGSDVITTQADLQYRASGAWGACTLTASRVTSKKGYANLTYNAQPTNTSTGAVATALGALADGALITIDLKDMVDAWAKGTNPNYGIRLDVGATAAKRLHSAQTKAGTAFVPRLVVTQYRTPTVPQPVTPLGGQQVSVARPKLAWQSSTDPLMKQEKYQLQMNEDDDLWTSPDYDSGEVTSTAGEHATTFDIANTETWFWRVRVKNGGGQWSPWTSGQEFGRTNKPTFTITQPTGGTWTDSTPPVIWSALSAGTQKQYQVQHLVGGVVKIDSGILPGADTSWTSELPIPGFTSGSVTTRVRLWDDVNRIATAGDQLYVQVDATWTYTPGVTGPFTGLVVVQNPTLPAADLTFSRATIPDRAEIQRSVDGGEFVSVAIVDAADISTGGTGFAYTDLTCPPHHLVTYRVVAGVNGIDADDSPEASVTLNTNHIWLLDVEDDTFWVALAGRDATSLAYTEDSEAVFARGADRAQVIFDSFHGFDGGVSGGVYGTSTSPHLGRTAQQMRDAVINHVKTYPTRVLRLVISDLNIPVIVRDATPVLRPEAELSYGITFTAHQQGELSWS